VDTTAVAAKPIGHFLLLMGKTCCLLCSFYGPYFGGHFYFSFGKYFHNNPTYWLPVSYYYSL